VKLRTWFMFGAALVCMACVACKDSPSAPPWSAVGIGTAGTVAPQTAGQGPVTQAGTGGAVANRPGTGGPVPLPPPSFPIGPMACFGCAPGCMDCNDGRGCRCDGALPEPQPWLPPFPGAVEEVGFRESSLPFCPHRMLAYALDVWSDSRGVFALVSGDRAQVGDFTLGEREGDVEADAGVVAMPQASFGADTVFNPALLTQLWLNDGHEWTLSLEVQNAAADFALAGAPESWLAVYDRGPAPLQDMFVTGVAPQTTSCTLGLLEGDQFECTDLDPVADLAAVNSNLAHALVGDTRLISYDGERWHAMTALLPFPASRLWADESRVLALGRIGTALWLEDGMWSFQDAGTVEHFSAVWGSARDDIWAGTEQGGIFHYDGSVWSERGRLGGVTCGHTLAINGIWGDGTQVYFSTATQLARFRAESLESIANWSCSPTGGGAEITGISGGAPGELFIAMVEPQRAEVDRCAPVFIVHYDGERFRRM
jgi:hypothetical protein